MSWADFDERHKDIYSHSQANGDLGSYIVRQMLPSDFDAFANAKTDDQRRDVILSALTRNTDRMVDIMSSEVTWKKACATMLTALWVSANINAQAEKIGR